MALSGSKKGDAFEEKMFLLFKHELESGGLGWSPSWGKIYKKRGYYSAARKKNIIFDIAIEFIRPGATECTCVFIIECKDYKGSVPVDDVEEFSGKLAQLSGVSIKGIFATNSAFQAGARSVAKANGFGLLRYFANATFKWELQRLASASISAQLGPDNFQIEKALAFQDFRSPIFDIFGAVGHHVSSSLWDFMSALSPLPKDDEDLAGARTTRPRYVNHVQYFQPEDVDAVAQRVLGSVDYRSGAVALDIICESEGTKTGLLVSHMERSPGIGTEVLGSITFSPLQINIFPQENIHRARYRFTLAHELGHYFLDHGRYMRGEYCEAGDFREIGDDQIEMSDIARMEWQANYFASCVLMPRDNFIKSFRRQLAVNGIADRGFGSLFLDDQSCNAKAFYNVATQLMLEYQVSKTAVRIRLERLGLLVNHHKKSTPSLSFVKQSQVQ